MLIHRKCRLFSLSSCCRHLLASGHFQDIKHRIKLNQIRKFYQHFKHTDLLANEQEK